MINPSAMLIQNCLQQLEAGYRQTQGDPAYAELIQQVAMATLHAIAHSDALYHNVEHTVLVTLVGQEILRGKQLREGKVSCRDWAHFLISLLCHDVGYVRGICRQDKGTQQTYTTGSDDRQVTLAAGASDAGLTPYHVDRSQKFVEEILENQPLLDLAAIQHNIELTRFPIPADVGYQDTASYAGLTRAADLLGQLSDPRYLEKIPALFYEFEEVGTNQVLGYRHPGDLRSSYPSFFRKVFPYTQQARHYLAATNEGRQILTNFFGNVSRVERELQNPDALPFSPSTHLPLIIAEANAAWTGRKQFDRLTVESLCRKPCLK